MDPKQILELLQQYGVVTGSQADDVLNGVNNSGKSVVELLVGYGLYESPEDFYQFLSTDLGIAYQDLRGFDPPAELLGLVPSGMARLYGAMPVNIGNEGITMALVDPLNTQVVDDLRFALGKEITLVLSDSEVVQKLIHDHYGGGGDDDLMPTTLESIFGGAKMGDDSMVDRDIEKEANSAPIIRYVDLVLFQAIRERASDIHFEPFEHEFKIRYRVDGALYEMAPPPSHLTASIISRIKVMSNLNIAERRIPQDGRIMKNIDDRQVDMRVSTLPTVYGESVVLRVLDRSSVNLDLENLGMPPFLFEYIGDTVQKPNGIFICTGPTGAGKTTTLYAALRRINTIDTKLLTAEDPVEYDMDGIMQVPVNEAIGLTFERVLRAFLRQDPDRIMVGEMRDLETAQIAIQASLTGHLVLSTLHTNDAPGAVTRLLDMGCESFLVAATLEAILAQRLLRTICPDCRVPYQPTEVVLGQLGITHSDIGDKEFFTGAGCDTCTRTGYKGRKGLYELLDVTDPIREMITDRAPSLQLKQKAIELGMTTLREDGLRNIYDGATSIEEVLKYT